MCPYHIFKSSPTTSVVAFSGWVVAFSDYEGRLSNAPCLIKKSSHQFHTNGSFNSIQQMLTEATLSAWDRTRCWRQCTILESECADHVEKSWTNVMGILNNVLEITQGTCSCHGQVWSVLLCPRWGKEARNWHDCPGFQRSPSGHWPNYSEVQPLWLCSLCERSLSCLMNVGTVQYAS